MPDEPTLRLRKPLERALRDGHPWVYRDAVSGDAPPGTIARVVDARGAFVARGVADAGPIALRVWTTRDEQLGPGLMAARVARAVELRRRVVPPDTDAFRLVNGEGDRLPGFVCDVYGRFAVLKTDGAGAFTLRDAMADALRPALDAAGVTTLLSRASRATAPKPGAPDGDEKSGEERDKARVRYGEPPPPRLAVRERGMTLLVDLLRGQKTGLFLDQRESRARVRSLARDLRVLNLYGYTGGFSVAAGLGGAVSVDTVDVAPAAVEFASATWEANGLDPARHRAHAADVPTWLAAQSRARARYDLIVADPPSFAPREDAREAALKSYRALHAACLALLSPGGYYLAGSCSSHVDRESFAQTVLDAASRGRATLQWLDAWGPPADHPRPAAFPEGDYLKVILLRAES